MTRRATTLAITAALCLSLVSGVSVAKGPPQFTPGSAGLDDPYYPLDGNGGYDVEHYLLDVSYDPSSDILMGTTTITAKATQNLSAFNLDLDGLIVRSATVNGQAASYVHEAGELTITPASPIRANTKMMIVIVYEGVPETLVDLFGVSGFIHTDDGALVIGQPHVAATWFPANDHPTDRAAFTFLVTVPDGLEVVANGTLGGQSSQAGWTTWQWDAPDPMSTYLAGMAIGELAIRSYTVDKIDYVDALDPDLLPRVTGHTGAGFVLSQQADDSYKRITRSIDVPAEGPATLSFWVNRDTEPGWDFFFVEAHTVGADDWTTLPDENGNTTQATGGPCPFPNLELLHPFLMHYQTANPPEAESPCSPTGSAGTPPGEWWAASGSSGGWEQWIVDLSPFAGTTAEVSLTYVSDDIVQLPGVFIDDIEISTADGSSSTSFEAGDTGGWQVPGVPPDGTENTTDWFIGTSADAPASVGEIAHGSLDRQSEIISFLEESFGPYPYDVGGGIVDDADIGFALENQTRPIYSKLFFSDSFSGDAVIVHELAHQWFGDNLTIEEWQHIWLNEGFATYAEWLWSEREGLGTAQEVFDFWYGLIPPDDPFWSVTIGDPGVNLLFDFSVYIRGGMTLHQLRLAVGEDAFFSILERWAKSQSGDTVTTNEFIALAEKVSGQQLDELFQTWLFTAGQPVVEASALRSAAPAAPIWLRASRELDGGPRK